MNVFAAVSIAHPCTWVNSEKARFNWRSERLSGRATGVGIGECADSGGAFLPDDLQVDLEFHVNGAVVVATYEQRPVRTYEPSSGTSGILYCSREPPLIGSLRISLESSPGF